MDFIVVGVVIIVIALTTAYIVKKIRDKSK
jgi:hypothetical protein